MKWLPFLFIVVFSCKGKPAVKEVNFEKVTEKTVSYNDSVGMPSVSSSWEDSGYFKGYMATTIDSLEVKDTTPLSKFLSDIVNKKDIVLLTKETLSHSVFIDQRREIRMDTFKNKSVTIISVYSFGDKEAQRITINGVVVKDYQSKGIDSLMEDAFDIDEHSFRYFSFKGREYYYFQAGAFYVSGGSMANVCYHLICNVDSKQLNVFITCRFDNMLFGDIDGDSDLDYLDFDNNEFCTIVPSSDEVLLEFYSCNKKGNFILQKDANGKVFFINGNTGDSFRQDSFNVKKSYWPLRLK